jgi:hypothetical protein
MIPDEVKRMRPLTGKERLGADRDSEFMGAEDIDPGCEPILTIKNIYNGLVTLSRGKEKKDFIVFAEETVPGIKTVRPLIVNATNRKTLRKLFKAVSADALEGKRIQLYLENNVRDPSSGDKVDGIRIRPRIPETKRAEPVKCADCGKVITAVGNYSAEDIARINQGRYGRCICAECSKKLSMAQEEKKQETDNEPTTAQRLTDALKAETEAP